MKKKGHQRHIVIAAGGTAGHLLPAQALASDLIRVLPRLRITFIGAGLEKNPYFKKGFFPFLDVASATPFRKNLIQIAQAFTRIGKGFFQCLKFMKKQAPDLIVGFGSYHTFPPLYAAKLGKIPMILFESNLSAGRVNRLCSNWAKISAVQFSVASSQLRSKTVCVNRPCLRMHAPLSQEEARGYFGLEKKGLTLLVFGGSQGSQRINQLVGSALDRLLEKKVCPQIIHITGSLQEKRRSEAVYRRYPISVCVKVFEEKMEYAWKAADLSISRSGSGTIAELIRFAVPSILIPYPYGVEDHQVKNAHFVTHTIRGGIVLSEKGLTGREVAEGVLSFLQEDALLLKRAKRALETFKQEENKQDLCSIVLEAL